ncbi:MAG: hypothetical protein AAF682_24395 [Planctomycetota bacterium]
MLDLRDLNRGLLDPTASPGALKALADDAFEAFAQRVELDQVDPMAVDARETRSAAGLALSPRDAARCLLDFRRTACFLRGLERAVRAAQRSIGGERVRVLYAGCGPFAPLALLLAPGFEPHELEFELLDLHERSLAAAAELTESLGLSAYVGGRVRADATSYRCAEGRRPHVVVTETMQRALEKEPQVSVVANLAPQLVPGGRLVPQEIALHAALLDLGAERTDGGGTRLGRVFRLDAATRLERLAPVRVTLPKPLPAGHTLAIETTLRIFGDVRLRENESGLTLPAPLHDLVLRGGETVEFEYRIQPSPGLVYRVVDPGE